MSKNGKSNLEGSNGSESTGTIPKMPTREQVREWSKRDLTACHYFLGMLIRYPDIIEKMADEIYQKALTSEQGAAIDKVQK